MPLFIQCSNMFYVYSSCPVSRLKDPWGDRDTRGQLHDLAPHSGWKSICKKHDMICYECRMIPSDGLTHTGQKHWLIVV